MALIQKHKKNIYGLEDDLENLQGQITDLQEILFQQDTTPTVEQGASEGDIWLDTTDDTLKVLREYPLGTGVFRWEPLLYKWDDTVDGGSW